MFRNIFTAFATLMLGAGAASATTPATDAQSLSLEQRVQAAQKTIGAMIDVEEKQAQSSNRLARYWNNGYYRPWHNWNNWNNWRNGHYRGYRY